MKRNSALTILFAFIFCASFSSALLAQNIDSTKVNTAYLHKGYYQNNTERDARIIVKYTGSIDSLVNTFSRSFKHQLYYFDIHGKQHKRDSLININYSFTWYNIVEPLHTYLPWNFHLTFTNKIDNYYLIEIFVSYNDQHGLVENNLNSFIGSGYDVTKFVQKNIDAVLK